MRKNGNVKRKKHAEKGMNTSLKDLSGVLNNHGRHGLLSFLSCLSFYNFKDVAYKCYDISNKSYNVALLTRCYFNIYLVLMSILRSTINAILSKFHSLTEVWNLSSCIYNTNCCYW